MKLNLSEIDCIFLSYDEPNADKNWADLLNKAPWAKRVHGVKGSDAAHKACANLSETEHFITVDAEKCSWVQIRAKAQVCTFGKQKWQMSAKSRLMQTTLLMQNSLTYQ